MYACRVELRLLSSIRDVHREDWNALVDGRHQPFARWEFLDAAESSGCASVDRGWRPLHLTLWQGGELIALAPAYLRRDSDGDFSRDFGWAASAERAGVPYYPKLIVSVPFTPVTGQRLFVRAGEPLDRAADLIEATYVALQERGVASFHVLFPTAEESALLARRGFEQRLDFQYHWRNDGYRTFDDFLARFDSKKRNQIKRERGEPARQSIEIATLTAETLAEDAAGWAERVATFHAQTVDNMAWGRRFVDRGFYERLFAAWLPSIEVVVATRQARPIALAFNVATPTHLFGRYWGAIEEHRFLHFNVCQYHSIERCIATGRQVFEGGAGGEHKLQRGFEPALTYSNHRIVDARLHRSLTTHLADERQQRLSALRQWQIDRPVLRRAANDVR